VRNSFFFADMDLWCKAVDHNDHVSCVLFLCIAFAGFFFAVLCYKAVSYRFLGGVCVNEGGGWGSFCGKIPIVTLLAERAL